MSIYRNRNFLLTYIASFISLFGSKLLMMSYVAYIYQASESATLASMVFAAEWTSSLVIGLFVTRYIEGQNAKRLLVKLNIAAALATLSFALVTAPEHYKFALLVIFLRALISHAVSSARIKALVQLFSKEETDAFSPIFNSSLFIATALAGAVGIFIQTLVSFTTIVLVDAATFLLAAGLISMATPNAERLAESFAGAIPEKGNRFSHLREAFTTMANNRSLASAVFYIILSVTAFQATYELVMTTIPQIWFGLGRGGTALFFTFESVFVTAGSFFYQYLNRRGFINERNQATLNLLAIAAGASIYLLLPQIRGNLYATLVAFNVMVVAVELIWTHQFKQMISNSPASRIASVSGVQMAMGYSLMGVFAFSFSLAVDRWSVTSAIYMNVALIALLVCGWELLVRARGAASVSNSPPSAAEAAIDA